MYFLAVLMIVFLSFQGTNARRCQISSHFRRYCGQHRAWFGITAEQCRARCDREKNCLVGHWHPPGKIWRNDNRPVCFTFRANDNGLVVCPWGNGALIGGNPGAIMIRCSAVQNNDIERCYPSSNFQRHCGNPVRVTYGESSERCRQRCNDMTSCHVAHWHPPKQIWAHVDKPVCWLFGVGTKVCPWGGAEGIRNHPGAQMIRCKFPTIKSFSYDINTVALIGSTPQVLGRIVITNHCPKENLHRCPDQSKTLIVSKTTTTTKSWSHTAGVSVTIGTKFSTGIPFVAKGEVSVEVTGSYSHTWGTTETETKTWTTNDQCVAGAGIKTTCEFFVTKKQLNVPFKILWSTGEYTHGMYKGVEFLYGGTTITPEFLTKRK